MVEWRLVLKTAQQGPTSDAHRVGVPSWDQHPRIRIEKKKGSSYVKGCCTGKLRGTRIL